MIIPKIRFIVPDTDVARPQILELANLQGWERVEETEKSPWIDLEIMWASRRTDTSIHYFEDNFIELNYLEILGENYTKIAPLILEHVAVVPRSEVIEYAKNAKTWDELVYAVRGIAGTASSEFDEEFFAIIERASRHDNRDVRHAALTAIGYTEWQECSDIVKRLAADDPDEAVQQGAKKLLKSLQDIWASTESFD